MKAHPESWSFLDFFLICFIYTDTPGSWTEEYTSYYLFLLSLPLQKQKSIHISWGSQKLSNSENSFIVATEVSSFHEEETSPQQWVSNLNKERKRRNFDHCKSQGMAAVQGKRETLECEAQAGSWWTARETTGRHLNCWKWRCRR